MKAKLLSIDMSAIATPKDISNNAHWPITGRKLGLRLLFRCHILYLCGWFRWAVCLLLKPESIFENPPSLS